MLRFSFPPAFRRSCCILLTAAIVSCKLLGQQDFNHFQTLQSQGAIPGDFFKATSEKIAEDMDAKRTDLSTAKEKEFLENIHSSIDHLLHSGSVIYGDEISEYVSAVADNLLRNEPELRRQLRFYTIKSNETNALSTDQGIVFVTTGLVSQLASEAQLAYILSHEISHYTEKHVIQTYSWKRENAYERNRLEKLSAYSKEHEFEADKLALRRYHAAGYSKEEVLSTFDVLMYSYLPFDEIEVPNSYFMTERLYIPDSYFATKKYPIKANENYNDDRSSHPNIKKRKDAITLSLKDYANWGTVVFSQSVEHFNYIRNLARFESIRTDIISADFGEALYSVFLLEREYPESVYLKQMKALAWLGLLQFREEGHHNKTVPASNDYEGESAAMYYFLRKLNKNATQTLAIRNILDLQRSLPEDEMLAEIRKRLTKTLAGSSHFSWSDYSTVDFHTMAQRSAAPPDSLKTALSEEEKPQSKYDRIKSQKSVNSIERFDSTQFYFYGLGDILSDTAFLDEYHNYKNEYNARKAHEEKLNAMTPKERYEYDREHKGETDNPLAIHLEKTVLTQPVIVDHRKGKPDRYASEKLTMKLSEILENVSQNHGVEINTIDHNDIRLNGTASFNERSTLYGLLEQTARYEDINAFPADYMLLKTIRETYGTSDLMYTMVEHHYKADINIAIIGVSTLLFPTLPITLLGYVPIQLLRGHRTTISAVIIDAASGTVKTAYHVEMRNKPGAYYLGSVYNYLFSQLKQTH